MTDKVIQYSLKGVAGASILYGYNIFFENKNFRDSSIIYDSFIFAGSVISGNFIHDLIDKQNPIKSMKFIGNFLEPLITASIYTFAYEYIYRKKYNFVNNRDMKSNSLLAFVIAVITQYLENPLLGFFTNMQVLN